MAVQNSLLEEFSGKFRCCWKILHRFSGSTKCYPCQALGIFRQGKWLLEHRPRLRERSWIFPSERCVIGAQGKHLMEVRELHKRILARNPCATDERRRKFVTQMHADLVFQACISFLRCFRTPVAPTSEILVYTGMLPWLVPSWPQMMQLRISFRSRSDLVLDADNALDFFYPISFYRRVSRFVVFQTKMAYLCFALFV